MAKFRINTGPMMTGVSYMIPVICLGGILQSFGTMLGGSAVGSDTTSFAGLLYAGGTIAMNMVVPVLAAYIAYGICDRPGIAPGLMIGVLSVNYKIGFVGGIIGGYAVGYFLKFMKERIPLSKNLQSLMPLLILPILGGLFSILLMDYVVGPLLGGLQSLLVEVFAELQAGPRVVFGLVMGAMMGVDFGGPVTKIATTVANGLVADGVLGPEGAKVCCGIVPALGLGIATLLFPRKFTKAERATGPSAIVLGCAQVGEGGLPFLLRDPLHIMPAGIAGSAVTGAVAMYFNVGSPVMMGGFFAFPVMQNIFPGAFIAVAAGVIVEIALVALIKGQATGEDELDEISGLDGEAADADFDISIEEG